ncbi:alpha/beta hydrolase [Actinoplanes sp. NPDC049265]|uniref:alpha/beta hydrolase n=1 Tax=Actinoplanes sp. NPDC049265 TaxID=3363902 RepID=UPI00372322E6
MPTLAAVLLTVVSLFSPPAPAPLAWGSCVQGPDDVLGAYLDQAGATCATLQVPVDYAHPSARTSVAVTRLKATDPAHRRGSLLLNPGGPGTSGLELAAAAPQYFGELLARYDIIGMDPRFTGRSDPIECDWTTNTFLRSAGPDRRTFDRNAALMRTLADGCVKAGRDRLPHATTRNTARDIDRLRIALGEDKINYLGYSYGTYLGAVYLQMFGDRAGRFVLDSAVDPDFYGPRLFTRNAPAMEDALLRFAGWAAERDATYHLGASPAAVLATVDRRQREQSIGSYRVDAGFLPGYLFKRLATAEYETMATELGFFGQAGPLPESLENYLRGLFTGDYDASDRSGTPILCADRPVTGDASSYYRDIERHRRDEPLFGPFTRNISPCAYWPVRGTEAPTEIGNDRPVLVVGADHDPITPYAGQLAMRKRLTGSSSVTAHDTYRHTVYKAAGNPCVDRVVTKYLLGETVPVTTDCPVS